MITKTYKTRFEIDHSIIGNEKYHFSKIPKQINRNGTRYYTIGDEEKRLFSVTTLLGDDPKKKKSLQKWRDRVGKNEAAKISRFAGSRGTRLHDLLESYVLGQPLVHTSAFVDNEDSAVLRHLSEHQPPPTDKDVTYDLEHPVRLVPPHLIQMFKAMKSVLDKNLTKVHALEHRLFSERLLLAGTADGIVEWNGKLVILDFKTSKKLKKEKWIEDYFLQCTAYSMMFKEMTNNEIQIDRCVVAIAVDEQDEPQVFEREIDTRRKATLLQRISEFHARRKTDPSEMPSILLG
jgi:hypothetical protein